MDLRPMALTPDQIADAKRLLFYQPFIVTDDFQCGVGYNWGTGNKVLQMERGLENGLEFERFQHYNAILRRTYDDWIAQIVAHYPDDIRQASLIDTACAEGYFLHSFAKAGIGTATGYEIKPRTGWAVKLLNEVLGHRVQFKNVPYDSWLHRIDGCAPADIVISSAIMVHLSDPTYYLNFLGDCTKRLLFLFSCVYDSNDMSIRYEQPRAWRKGAKFPVCFDGRTSISTGLLRFALKEKGFSQVIELPVAPDLPIDWAWHKALIAIKE